MWNRLKIKLVFLLSLTVLTYAILGYSVASQPDHTKTEVNSTVIEGRHDQTAKGMVGRYLGLNTSEAHHTEKLVGFKALAL